MKTRRALAPALAIAVMLLSSRVHAATVPSDLLYEGRILDGSGNAITSAIVLRFSLWKSTDRTPADASGSTINVVAANYGGWQEVQTIIPSGNGIVSVHMGSGTALPEIDFTQHKYLQVEVKSSGQPDASYVLLDPTGDGGADTVDRRFIASVAYAKNAENIRNRTVGTSSGSIPLLGSGGTIGADRVGNGTNALGFKINASDASGDATMTFGNALLSQILKFSAANQRFEFSKDVYVTGDLAAAGTASGSRIHAQNLLTASGSAVFDGSTRFNGTTVLNGVTYTWPAFSAAASGKVLKVDPATDRLSWSDDLTGSAGTFGTGNVLSIGDNRYMNVGGDTMTGALKVRGNLSGSTLTVDGLRNCSTMITGANGNLSCGGMVTKTKTQNQSVTTNTMVETDLSFNMGVNETWVYVYDLDYIVGSVAADSKFAVTAPVSSTCHTKISYMNASSEQLVDSVNTCGQNIVALIGAAGGVRISVRIYGDITTGPVSGSGMLRWAQNTANASANTLFSGSTLMAFKTVGSDVAEVYHTQDASVVPGTVVSIDPDHPLNVRRSRGAYDNMVLGVISTKPGLTIGGDDLQGGKGMPVFLALAGRVPVMVSGENGPIRPGDLLTASSTPGVAMKATKAGPVIGKALGSHAGKKIGVVTVFIRNQDGMIPLAETAEDR